MQQSSTLVSFAGKYRRLLHTILCCLLLNAPGLLTAQTDSTKQDEAAAPEVPELIAPSLNFLTVQKGDNSIDLKSEIKAKVKGSVTKLSLLKVTYVQVTDTEEKVLGFVISDQQGKAVFNAKTASLKTDAEGKLHFKALFAGNKSMDPAEAEVTIKRARLEIIPIKEDSVNILQVKLVAIGSGNETVVPEIALGVYVQRLFNPLKVGEGTTDSTGMVSVEIPANLPGDTKGNITLLAKLDENELYGNLETAVVQPWGASVSNQVNELPRALWSPHPPIWMVVTFVILMAAVWGHYIVIIVQLFRLRKEEPHAPIQTATS